MSAGPNSTLCVDASLIVQLVTQGTYAHLIVPLWTRWPQEARQIVAPPLLYYEVANALHRYRIHDLLTSEEEDAALEAALNFDIVLYGDSELHQRAVQIARNLDLSALSADLMGYPAS